MGNHVCIVSDDHYLSPQKFYSKNIALCVHYRDYLLARILIHEPRHEKTYFLHMRKKVADQLRGSRAAPR